MLVVRVVRVLSVLGRLVVLLGFHAGVLGMFEGLHAAEAQLVALSGLVLVLVLVRRHYSFLFFCF